MTEGISVIIPTKQRTELVARAVASPEAASRHLPPSCAWGVLLVDDSPEPDAAAIAALAEDAGAVRYLRGPAAVGAKRNLGAAEARHDYLVFVDSDCRAEEDFLTGHLSAAGRRKAPSGRSVGAIAGLVGMANDAQSWLTRLADYSPLLNAPFGWPARFAELYWACRANLALSRTVFERIGGFDEETFTVVGGEDVDLSLRLQDAGYAIWSEPSAVAVHTRTLLTSFRDMARKMLLYGRSSVYNTRRHPSSQRAARQSRCLPGARCRRAGRRPAGPGRRTDQGRGLVRRPVRDLMRRQRKASALTLPATASSGSSTSASRWRQSVGVGPSRRCVASATSTRAATCCCPGPKREPTRGLTRSPAWPTVGTTPSLGRPCARHHGNGRAATGPGRPAHPPPVPSAGQLARLTETVGSGRQISPLISGGKDGRNE